MGKLTYKESGVDIEVYRESISRLGALLRRTRTPRVVPSDNGFAGLFQLDFDSALFSRGYEQPVLVFCCDGVGTKLKMAAMTGIHTTIGIDLVAMSVNDVICCGAEPLVFLDYVAMSRDDPSLLEQIVGGISDGCVEADCALIGGETAIMPDVYATGDFDLVGFCAGVVERRRIIDGAHVAAGDAIVGVASSGLHSNGYSMARKIVFEVAGLSVDERVDELEQTVGEVLLEPTRIYVRAVRRLLVHYKVKYVIHAIAHVTGGGLSENLERVLPEGARAVVRDGSWPVPPVFHWLERLGDVENREMRRVFNMGLGLVLVVSPYYADSIRRQLADDGLASWAVGEVIEGPRGVDWA